MKKHKRMLKVVNNMALCANTYSYSYSFMNMIGMPYAK